MVSCDFGVNGAFGDFGVNGVFGDFGDNRQRAGVNGDKHPAPWGLAILATITKYN